MATGRWWGPNTFPQITGVQGGIGRLNKVKPHPAFDGTTNKTVFAANHGGLWKSTDLGENWTNLTENHSHILGRSSVSDMVIHAANPNLMYVATGVKARINAGWPGNEALYPDFASSGVFKSADGGNTWQTTGLSFSLNEKKIISELHMDPTDPLRMYAVVYSHIFWDSNESNWGSLWRSEDGGGSWTEIFKGPAWDMEFKPDDPSIFYLAGMNNLMKFTNYGGTPNANLDCNHPDCEDLMPRLFDADMKAFVGSGVVHLEGFKLGVSPAFPQKLYVLQVRAQGDGENLFDDPNKHPETGADFGGIFVSEDVGQSFDLAPTTNKGVEIENNGFGNPVFKTDLTAVSGSETSAISVEIEKSTLVVDPQDEEKVFLGGFCYGFSDDGGTSFHVVHPSITNNLHVDIRDIAIAPNDPKYVFVVEDASFAYSEDGGLTFHRPACNNLSIGMIYRFGISNTPTSASSQKIIGGFLDVNSMIYESQTWVHPSGSTNQGDGMEALFDPQDSGIAFRTAQEGWLSTGIQSATNGSWSFSVLTKFPGGDGAWVTPMVMDKNSTLYIAKTEIFRRPQSAGFSSISNFSSVGQNGVKLNVLEVAPSDPNVIYAGYWNGVSTSGSGAGSTTYTRNKQIFKTVDGGLNWVDITPTGTAGLGHSAIFMGLTIDPDNPRRIWTCFTGYDLDKPSNGFGKRRVMMSENGGVSWTAYSEACQKMPQQTASELIPTPMLMNSIWEPRRGSSIATDIWRAGNAITLVCPMWLSKNWRSIPTAKPSLPEPGAEASGKPLSNVLRMWI